MLALNCDPSYPIAQDADSGYGSSDDANLEYQSQVAMYNGTRWKRLDYTLHHLRKRARKRTMQQKARARPTLS